MAKEDSSTNTQHPRPKTLITGGAGFLGSHLCDRFISEGHQVICVDNLLTGRKENIAHLLDNEDFTFVLDIDVLMSKIQHPSPNTEDLNYILHFACPASPKDYLKYPIETMKVEALGTYNMLELARKNSAVFLLASTSEVYGDPEVNPQPEAYWGYVNPIGPRSVYDEAKRYAEALTMAYHRKYGMDIRIARIFNTYGPRMKVDDGRVVSNFIVQALKGTPITVYGDGSQTRSFCYVDDLIEVLYRFLIHKGSETGPINLGNPEEVSILDFAKEVLMVTGSKSKMVLKPLPEDDPKVREPDITKARALLRWEPRINRRKGLEKTLEYFRGKLWKA